MTGDTTLDEVMRRIVRDVVRAELTALGRADHPQRNGSDAYLSVARAARVADVAPGTIRAWIRHGRLTGKRAGRVLRVSRTELEQFMSGAPTGPRGDDIRERAARRLQQDARALRKRAA